MREEEKVKRTLREAAKKGDKDTCKILAKEVIRARKAISKIHTTKAHLNSVQLQLKNQLGKFCNRDFLKFQPFFFFQRCLKYRDPCRRQRKSCKQCNL